MKIFLQNHKYEYDIQTIVRVFFPDEAIEFVDSRVELKDGDIAVYSKFEEQTGNITFQTVIRIQDTESEGFARQKLEDEHSNNAHRYHKICRETAKLSFYRAAKKIMQIGTPWGILTGIRPSKRIHALLDEGKSDEEVIDIMTEKYAASEEKIRLALTVAHNEQKILEALRPNSVGIYIGIPFCPTRCVYCSFVSNSFQRAKKMIEPYVDALIREITHTINIIKEMYWQPECIYIGGGTPTTLLPLQLERLLDTLCIQLEMSNIKEFTVEAGRPDTIDKEKLKVLKKYGVNRLSINPQTMNTSTLKKIGRLHTPEDTVKAFELAREFGFDNINTDVIIGLPEETFAMYCHTLTEVQKLDPENITVHTMSIKRSSMLYERKKEFSMTQSNIVQEMLSFTQNFMEKHHKQPYYMYRQKNMLGNFENVGYCKDGFEGIYNIQIMEEKHSIIAMGCGAVTKMVDTRNNRIDRIFNVKEVKDYIDRIDEMLERKNRIYEYFKSG